MEEKKTKRKARPEHITGLEKPFDTYWNENAWWETELLSTRFIQSYLGRGSEEEGMFRYNAYLQGILGQYTLRGSARKVAGQLRSLRASKLEQSFLAGMGVSSPDELRKRIRTTIEQASGLQTILRSSDQYSPKLSTLFGILQKSQQSGESFIRGTLELMAKDDEHRIDTDKRVMDLIGRELLQAVADKLSKLDKEGMNKFLSSTPLFEISFVFDPIQKTVAFKTKTTNQGKYNKSAEDRVKEAFNGKNISAMSNAEIVDLIKQIGQTRTEKSFLRQLMIVAKSLDIPVPYGLSQDDIDTFFTQRVSFEGMPSTIIINYNEDYAAAGSGLMRALDANPTYREQIIKAINDALIEQVVTRFGGDAEFLRRVMEAMIRKDKMAFFIEDNKLNIAGRLGEIMGTYIFAKLTNNTDVSGLSPTQSVLVYEATTKNISGHAKGKDVSSDLTMRLANLMFGIQIKNYKNPVLIRDISLHSLLDLSHADAMISPQMEKKLAYYYGSRAFYSQDKINLIPQVRDFIYRAIAALHTIQVSNDQDLNTNIGFLIGENFVFSSEMLQVILEALNAEVEGKKDDTLTLDIDEPGSVSELLVKQDTTKEVGFFNSGFSMRDEQTLLSRVKLTSRLDLGRMIAQNVARIAH